MRQRLNEDKLNDSVMLIPLRTPYFTTHAIDIAEPNGPTTECDVKSYWTESLSESIVLSTNQ